MVARQIIPNRGRRPSTHVELKIRAMWFRKNIYTSVYTRTEQKRAVNVFSNNRLGFLGNVSQVLPQCFYVVLRK